MIYFTIQVSISKNTLSCVVHPLILCYKENMKMNEKLYMMGKIYFLSLKFIIESISYFDRIDFGDSP